MIVVGVVVCAAWYYTIIAGFFVLYCPVLYLMFIHHRLYRKVADTLFAIWELYPVGLFQCCCSTKLHHYGDYVDKRENSIIIVNHRTRVDWNYLWIALYHATQDTCNKVNSNLGETSLDKLFSAECKTKIVLKDELKNIPGLGWIMQLNYFLYVKRDWTEDQLNLTQFADYYSKTGTPYRIILFPEGTDFSVENKRKSDRYAVINTLPLYEYVLHPRTTGWCSLVTELRKTGLSCVYDVTLGYDNPPQTELHLIKGRFPKHVHVLIKKYLINELPSNEDGLKYWLNEKWTQKEHSLRCFHRNGTFQDLTSLNPPIERTPQTLNNGFMYFIFWTVIDILFTHLMLNSMWFQFWILYHSMLFIFVTKMFGGFHKIQHRLFMGQS